MSNFTIPSLAGKVIMITGANAGIGLAMVHSLAAHSPSKIYLCVRTASKAQELLKTLEAQYTRVSFMTLPLQLDDFNSVKACASQFNATDSRLHLLFLNAGVAHTEPGLTKDGYETQFGINHMGNALLTQLLMPRLQQTLRDDPSADVRIVSTSSGAADGFVPKTTLDLEGMRQPDKYSGMTHYGHSKLANVLFARGLAERYPQILSTSAHPGVVKSEIWGKSGSGWGIKTFLEKPLVVLMGVTTEEGAKSEVWCAVAKRKDVKNGGFYAPVGKLVERKPTEDKLVMELWDWTSAELKKHGAPGWPTV